LLYFEMQSTFMAYKKRIVMKKQGNISRGILIIAAVTGVLLLIPLIAMQFTNEVNWTGSDFLVAGALLFTIGAFHVIATRNARNLMHRVAMGLGMGAMLLMIWANLAVGIIGSGPNAGNLMYIAVVIIAVVGIVRSHFLPDGMGRAMFGIVLSLVFVTGIALLTGMDRYPGSSMNEILGVNAFLAAPFILSGLLFRHLARQQSGTAGGSNA
jgi:hypothetical protein